jgi:hypothetical protein
MCALMAEQKDACEFSSLVFVSFAVSFLFSTSRCSSSFHLLPNTRGRQLFLFAASKAQKWYNVLIRRNKDN